MPQRTLKRSRAITLVLAGSAVLAGCDTPVEQRDAYASLADCTKDWETPTKCEPVADGRYARSYYYGPPYFGSALTDGRPRPSPNAMEAVYLKRAASGSSTSRSWFSSRSTSSSSTSRSSSSSSSSSTSRGGFGSSGRSASSSGS
jgi:uncharacterized protein YgiB involved in biofilm formation